MFFQDTLRSLEALAYETALWFVLLPKTLLAVIMSVGSIQTYVDAELKKPTKRQFNELLSPILFLLIGCVVPLCFVAFSLEPVMPENAGNRGTTGVFGVEWDQDEFVLVAVMLLVLPISLAAVAQVAARGTVSRESLKSSFYGHCYLITPFFLIVSMIGFIIMKYGPPKSVLGAMGCASAVIPTAWFLISEVRALSIQARVSKSVSVLLLVLGYILSGVLSCAFFVLPMWLAHNWGNG